MEVRGRPYPDVTKASEIYVVTHGSYSDYHIVGVFSAWAKAQRFAKKYEAEHCVEDYEDPPGIERRLLDVPYSSFGCYEVSIWFDGEVSFEHFEERKFACTLPHVDNGPWASIVGYGKTAEHARRSAEEYRRQLVASNKINPRAKHSWREKGDIKWDKDSENRFLGM